MLVTRLVLKNWRNFLSVDVGLRDRAFFVGPNAAGKSNLLDSLLFLRDLAKEGGGLQTAVRSRGGLSRIRCFAARRTPDVEIDVSVAASPSGAAEWRYEIGIGQQNRGERKPVLRFERVRLRGQLIRSRPDEADTRDPLRMTETLVEQISENKEFRPLVQFFQSIQYLHLVPQLLRHPASFTGPPMPSDPYGRAFLERVASTPERTRKSRLAKIERALAAAIPNLAQLSFIEERGVPHLQAVLKHWRPKAGLQREEQFSDGTLRLIALLWSFLDGEAPLLLEEPELSLHRAVVEKIPSLVSSLTRNRKRQVLISTHSPELLMDGGIAPEEIILLEPRKEGTSVSTGAANDEVRRLLESGLAAGDVVLAHTAPGPLDQLTLFEE